MESEMNQPWWFGECQIIENYSPPGKPNVSKCVVQHIPSGWFLRYSLGPRQGHFWDIYGDDYLNENLARLALHQAPQPPISNWPEGRSEVEQPLQQEILRLRGEIEELQQQLEHREKTNKHLRARLHEARATLARVA